MTASNRERGQQDRLKRSARDPIESEPRRAGPTIHDVARVADVSIGSESKALNNNGQLSQQAREKIIAVADALREAGQSVPGAVSLVGFDNWRIVADATRPPLTSVDMNLVELGRERGRRLLDLIAGRLWQGVHAFRTAWSEHTG